VLAYSQINEANAYYSVFNTTTTANNAISPDGTQNATNFNFDANAAARVEKALSGTYENETHTVSVYAKVTSGTQQFRLKCTHAGIVDYLSNDLTVTTEWQRFTFTQAFGASVGSGIVPGITNSTNGTAKNILFYGFQLEVNSSYATSLINTNGASATRVADACFKDSITSLIGQTEGTIFADIIRTTSTSNDTFWVNISDGTTNDWIFMGTEGTAGRFYVRVGNSVKVDEYPAFSVGRHKIALAYKSGQIAGYMDGVQLFTSTATFTLTSLTRMSLGPSSASGNVINTPAQINQAVLFPTRLTNAELASLTTI
jgi:hypothetical protein